MGERQNSDNATVTAETCTGWEESHVSGFKMTEHFEVGQKIHLDMKQ